MRALLAFLKKEWMETVRSGKLLLLIIIFTIFGIMNPAIAKLTPWLMEMMADSLSEAGLTIIGVEVDALTSWVQFFKNIPMGLMAFVLIYSGMFTREYQTGTLVLMLTRGLPRRHVVLAKSALMLLLWTAGYFLCFAVTFGYNACFWDNGVAAGLWEAAVCWWLFGAWTVSLTVIFAALSRSSAGVLLGTGGAAVISYAAGLFPKLQIYVPTALTDISGILSGAVGAEFPVGASAVAVCLSAACVALSILVMNRKRL